MAQGEMNWQPGDLNLMPRTYIVKEILLQISLLTPTYMSRLLHCECVHVFVYV